MRISGWFKLFSLAILGFTCSAAQAGNVILASSTFDTSMDGWTSNTPAQVVWSSVYGDPPGSLLFTDATGAGTVVYAPSSFLGNYLAMGVTSISFEDNIIAETEVTYVSKYGVTLSGPDGSATYVGSQPPATYPTGWIPVTALISPIMPDGWTVTSGTWLGLLSDVEQVEIPIELVTNGVEPVTDIEAIDNASLQGEEEMATPEPSSLSLMGMGVVLFGMAWYWRRRTHMIADRTF
jgi:hypothetical protein